MKLKLLNISAVSLALGVSEYQLRRLAAAGEIPFAVVGRCKAFAESDLSAIRRACVKAGYITDPKPEAAASC